MRSCAGCNGLAPAAWPVWRVCRTTGVRQAARQLQRERGGGRVRGEDIRQLLAGQFGVAYSLNGVYDLMKRLGLVWMSARAVSPYADPVAQAEFKKKLRPGSRGNAWCQALRLRTCSRFFKLS